MLYFSDVVLVWLVEEPLLSQLQWVKGLLEVLLTAVLIYVITRSAWRKLLRKDRVIEEASVGITICDSSGDNPVLYANKAFEATTGYTETHIRGESLSVLWEDTPDSESVKMLEEGLENGEQVQTQLDCTRGDGGSFISQIELFPVFVGGQLEQFVVFYRDITEREETREKLLERERQFRQIAENIQEVFYLVTADYSKTLYVNSAYEEIWGRSVEALYEDPWDLTETVVEEDRQKVLGAKQDIIEQRPAEDQMIKYRIRRSDGEIRWVRDRMVPIRNEEGDLVRIAGTVLDITEQQQLHNKLKKSLRESQTLLKEVHHRVKNNMQILLGLVGLQERDVANESARSVLEQTRQRILSMSLIHKQLYEAESISELNFSEYVENLVTQIVDIQDRPDRQVSVTYRIESTDLEIDTIIPCGLILNELVTNSLQHGIPSGESGEIIVEYFQEDSQNHLVVSDNGQGANEQHLKDSSSLGMRLVRNLATDQLNGELHVTNNDGLTVEVVFPPGPSGIDSTRSVEMELPD